MNRARRSDPAATSSNAVEFRRAFIDQVHQLVRLGYDRLDPAEHAKATETAITGHLLQAMEQVCDDPPIHVKSWIGFYHPAEETPVHAPGRTGSHRQRLDIRITSLQTLPRGRFCFEAKRLGPNHPVSKYLGDEGLGCFLNGEYAPDDDTGGMLGYVQSKNVDHWAAQIAQSLDRSAKKCLVTEPWIPNQITDGPDAVFRTQHSRRTVKRDITVFHSLLRFHG